MLLPQTNILNSITSCITDIKRLHTAFKEFSNQSVQRRLWDLCSVFCQNNPKFLLAADKDVQKLSYPRNWEQLIGTNFWKVMKVVSNLFLEQFKLRFLGTEFMIRFHGGNLFSPGTPDRTARWGRTWFIGRRGLSQYLERKANLQIQNENPSTFKTY